MYGIYANIKGILMINVTIYIAYMDPMGNRHVCIYIVYMYAVGIQYIKGIG